MIDAVCRALTKLRKEYPEFVTYVTKHDIEHVRTPILSAFYGQNPIPAKTNLTWLKGIDTDEFLNKTYSGKEESCTWVLPELFLGLGSYSILDVNIVGCQFGEINCTGNWRLKKTLYGYCMEG